jgi:PmbA protein
LEPERFLAALASERPDGTAVREWSVYFSESTSLELGIKDRQIGNAHVPLKLAESCGARYRLIWSDGKVSRGYVERRLLESEPQTALSNARAAAYDDPDAAWVLPQAPIPDVELHDAEVAGMAAGDTRRLVPRLAAVRRRMQDRAFRTWSGSFSAGAGRSRVVSSAGLDVHGESTSAGWHVTFNGEIGDGFSARALESDEEFTARLDRLAETATLLQRPVALPRGGSVPVILHPHVVSRYAIGTLLDNLGGATVAHGEGHFRREQFGSDRPVLREDIGFRIDPLQPLKSGSYRYTTEGLPAAPCVFVERGRLVQPVLDLKYARRLGLDPTPLPSDSDAMFFEGPPPLSLAQALEQAAGGALVLSVLGIHTQDSASGDFSLAAPQALTIGTTGLAGRVRATISGNLFDLLSDDELQFVTFEGENIPGLLWRCRFDPQ